MTANLIPSSDKLQAVLLKASLFRNFRRKLINSPEEILRNEGIDVPEGVRINVVEDDQRTVTIPLPPFVGQELSTEDLDVQYAANDWTACTLCVLTSIVCTAGTLTSIIVATQGFKASEGGGSFD